MISGNEVMGFNPWRLESACGSANKSKPQGRAVLQRDS